MILSIEAGVYSVLLIRDVFFFFWRFGLVFWDILCFIAPTATSTHFFIIMDHVSIFYNQDPENQE